MSIMIKTNGITKKEWSDTIMLFEDSSIYQTWEYGDTKWGEKNLRHLIVYKNEELIAAVQIRLIKLFPFNRGIAYIYRGPFWRPKNKVKNTENLKIILSEIRK